MTKGFHIQGILLGLSICLAAAQQPALTQERPPIIDMHMHVFETKSLGR